MQNETEGNYSEHDRSRGTGERIISTSGYLLVGASVIGFLAAGAIQVVHALRASPRDLVETWLDLVQQERATLTLVIMAFVAAHLGKRLLTTAQLSIAQTIPDKDLPLVRQAVIDGKPEPIDQYVRLRSLSGMSGNFTKLGVTGLPLTTVFLTLVFSLVALIPIPGAAPFMDLAKLTLGAFIGSFVQRNVEQRRQGAELPAGTAQRPPDLVA